MKTYSIYKVTNIITNKYYVGVESTKPHMEQTQVKPLSLLVDFARYGLINFKTEDVVSGISREEVKDEINKCYLDETPKSRCYNKIKIHESDHKTEHGSTEAISKEYSFIYVTRCIQYDSIYVGSHTTNNINDGYLGSSRPLLKLIRELGKDAFVREIIQFTSDMETAKYYERNIIEHLMDDGMVTLHNRNIVGAGGNYGDETNAKISGATKNRWNENYDYMKEKIHNPESNALRGKAQSDWIKANPEAHQERMMKINKNPEKIAKMAEKHRGMKRSDETKANIKAAKKAAIAKLSDEERGKIYGKGNVYVTDLTTYVYRSEPSDYVLKENELYGMVKDPKAPLKKRAVVTNINTWREYWREVGYVLEDYERKGNVLAVKKKMRERGELV